LVNWYSGSYVYLFYLPFAAMSKEFSLYTDAELWQAFRSGDEDAFDYIFEKYVRVLYNYGHKFTRAAEVIEDCVQDLFIELWEKRTVVGPTDSIKYYLFKSLRLKIIRRLGREQKYTGADHAAETHEFTISFSYEFHLITDQADQEQRQELVAALNALSNRQKEAIQLKYYDNLSYPEIASVMAISVDSVYKLISAALATLRKHVRQIHFLIFWGGMLLHTLL
jgi:RNA polymerase sigma factor (sigma-70 family)